MDAAQHAAWKLLRLAGDGDELAETELLARAGRGDAQALRAMHSALFTMRDAGFREIFQAELLARLLAACGERNDAWRLVSTLSGLSPQLRRYAPALADEWDAEAMGLLSTLADKGDGHAVDALAAFGSVASPAAVELAKAGDAAPAPVTVRMAAPEWRWPETAWERFCCAVEMRFWPLRWWLGDVFDVLFRRPWWAFTDWLRSFGRAQHG